SNLLLDYRMDGTSGFDAINSVGQVNGQLIGPPHRVQRTGDELRKNIAELSIRPNIRFTQGEYDSHFETTTHIDTIENEQVSVFATLPEIDMTRQGITQTPIDTIIGYAANTWSYTLDADGNVLDSSWIVPDTYLVNQYEQNLHQVQNYITPYGIGLDLGPDGFTWVYDVTDYLPILHDTVDIRAGNQQELIDLKFAFIKGTPARDIVDFETIWTAQYNHADIANDNVMQAKDVQLHPEATEYRVKTRTTGHRFGGFQNCAEFCPKYHNLSINGGQQFEWLNWKSCGENPVIDQGGTWIYDRAGWCPGEFSDTYNHEITPYVTPGGIASIDYGMEITPAGMEGVYQVAVQLVSYAGANFSLDASVEEIIAPNDWEYRNRVNPICGQPRIVIKNNGTTPLTSLEVTCNVVGGSEFTSTWEGNLEYLESGEITIQLPSMEFWTTPNPANIFEVRVSSPNGGADEYDGNNYGMATFDRPDHYTGDIALFVKANNAGNENSYTIKNIHGDVVLSRNDIASRESYEDLIGLPDGCYCLEFLDSDEDGLEFFANNDGNGRLYIVRPNNGPVLKSFNPNFGSFVRYCFTLEGATNDISIPEAPRTIDVAPNPGSGLFHVTLSGFANIPITVKVSDVTGRTIYSQEMIPSQESFDHFIDLSSESSGLYFLKVAAPDRTTVERLIKK
ncbi:MAG: hypothetical protein CL946_05780, partial [Ectothiorhodospiraceae bacterium]|nr:hypothetical protein [Ectothiorhodospiraceae bacterium]